MNHWKSHQKRAALILLLCAAAQAVLLSGCALFPEEEEPIPVPLIEIKQADYLTRTPQRMTIENRVEGSAEITARRSAHVSFKNSSGRLAEMYFDNGEYVEEGDLLCTLEASDIGEQLKESEMRAEISEMEYRQAAERYKAGELDEIGWKRAKLNIYIVRRDLKKLRDRFEKTQLYAPMSGQITYRAAITVGEMVNPQDTLFTISSLDRPVVRYAGTNFDKLPLHAECDLTLVLGTSEETFKGTVIQTPEYLPETAVDIDRFSVLLELDRDLPEGVSLGMKMNLSYLIERSENTLVIAKSALKTAGSRTYVYVLEDGYRQERDVVTGVSSAYDIEIVKGLEEDDQIIY